MNKPESSLDEWLQEAMRLADEHALWYSQTRDEPHAGRRAKLLAHLAAHPFNQVLQEPLTDEQRSDLRVGAMVFRVPPYDKNPQSQRIADLMNALAQSSRPLPHSFLDLLINACEAGDISEECEQADWREIYVRAKALYASPQAAKPPENAK